MIVGIVSDKIFVRWFVSRELVLEQLRVTEPDDILFVNTPGLRVELSIHNDGPAAKATVDDALEICALAAASSECTG